jgi:hypothetical protein
MRQVVNLCASAHEIWSLPLQIAVALALMWTQVCLRSPSSCHIAFVWSWS